MSSKNDLHMCQNCLEVFKTEEIIPVEELKDFFQRVTPGEVCPSGECKKCGAVCHPLDSVDNPMPIDQAIMNLNVTLRNLTTKLDDAIGEMRKKNNLEVKRLEYNRTKETLAAIQKLADLGKAGALPPELQDIAGLIQGRIKKGKKDAENPEAGGS